jgi:hypothetical protein
MSLHIFGIRHHGPGCARGLRQALETLEPDVIVLEAPADAEPALALAGHNEMQPPVALLIYPPEEPSRAVYYPFTVFSPEWQTLRWATERNVPVRLMDLPQAHHFALWKEAEQRLAESEKANGNGEETPGEPPSPASDATVPVDVVPADSDEAQATWRTDPLALLAEAAGYKDHELWWEEQIERRRDATDLFSAILEAMRTVRENVPMSPERDSAREAYMRKSLRSVLKEGFNKVAVVCGAWHSPVLDEDSLAGKREGCRVKDDDAILKSLPKVKTAATWIPWTYSRLTRRSGYGAGVHSPGWYAHLWTSRDEAPTRWLATAARLLREKDLDASSASVIEAVRLADALAAMRELRSPGLAELNEAILAVLCHGEKSPLSLIRNRLEVGDVLGSVPSETLAVPLAQDLAKLQTSLRLKPSTETKRIDLDLRKEIDRGRSHLLHRLRLLGIDWGSVEASGGRASTFHEVWQIEWKPEFAVAIIEANVWGNTVEAAATAKVVHQASEIAELPGVTALLDTSVLAGLKQAIEPLLNRIQMMTAVGTDVRHLMDAMPPLARVARYGDVRGTRGEQIEPILFGMFERVLVGLGAACSSLDDDAAERMLESTGHVREALGLLDRSDLVEEWLQALRKLLSRDLHALLRGWFCRLLLDQGALEDGELERFARLALSTANPPADCAAWATGLLRGSGLLLVHQDSVWRVFNHWLCGLDNETFIEMLPLLRRAFADFSGPERRQMGEKVKRLRSDDTAKRVSFAEVPEERLNAERARKVLPVLAHILGVNGRGDD